MEHRKSHHSRRNQTNRPEDPKRKDQVKRTKTPVPLVELQLVKPSLLIPRQLFQTIKA